MNLLSFVARPFYLESPTSILIRTAKFNGYRNVWHMCTALGISQSSRPRDIRLKDQPLCNLLCSEAPCLESDLREVFFEHPAKQHLRGWHIKVGNLDVTAQSLRRQFFSCPLCLKLGYSRVPQDFAFFDFCPAHNVLLTASCPNCGRINMWKKICGFTCECGFDLAEAEVVPYRHRLSIAMPSIFAVSDASQLINDHLRDEEKKIKLAEPYLIDNMPNQIFYALIQNALQVDLATYRQLPVSVFESVWLTVKNQTLQQFAIDYLRKNHQSSGTCEKENCCNAIKLTFAQLQHAIGAGIAATRSFINEMSLAPALFPEKNTIGYSHPQLCKAIQSGLQLRRQHRIAQHTKEYFSLGTAAALLKTTTTSMADAVKRGFFPGTVIGDRVYFIPNTSIDEFKKQFVFYSEISDLLGIPRKTLNRLSSQLGLTHAYARQLNEPAIYLRNSMNLSRMRKFLNNFKPLKSRRSPAIQELTTLAKQLDLSVPVLYHILRTYCSCSTPSKMIPSQRSELEQWLAGHTTLKVASQLLNIDIHTLNARFIRSSLIQKIDICRIRFIAIESLQLMDAHLKKYKSCIEASKLLCIAETLVIKLVEQGKLKHILLKTSATDPQILIEM